MKISYCSHQHQVVINTEAFEAHQADSGGRAKANNEQANAQETESFRSKGRHDMSDNKRDNMDVREGSLWIVKRLRSFLR